MAGYNIECDPGDLYSRKCYVVTGAGGRQEIIGYDSAGNPISKQATTAAGTAWQPSITVLDQDGNPDRGWGGTAPALHDAGTPVTVARPHPDYPGFYYTVQLYPVNATGTEAHVVVSVGYGTVDRFRVQTFRSVYSPAKF